MTYGLQTGGPFHGFPCVNWAGSKEGPASFSQEEFIGKLERAEKMFNLDGPKKLLVADFTHDTTICTIEALAPLVRLARLRGWTCVLEVPSTELPAVASEFNAVVAWHAGRSPAWLRFPCAGIVVPKTATFLPEFDQVTAGLPKFLQSRGEAETFKVLAQSPFLWCVQEGVLKTHVEVA